MGQTTRGLGSKLISSYIKRGKTVICPIWRSPQAFKGSRPPHCVVIALTSQGHFTGSGHKCVGRCDLSGHPSCKGASICSFFTEMVVVATSLGVGSWAGRVFRERGPTGAMGSGLGPPDGAATQAEHSRRRQCLEKVDLHQLLGAVDQVTHPLF